MHTGETSTRDSFVAADRDDPGAQRFLLEDVVVTAVPPPQWAAPGTD